MMDLGERRGNAGTLPMSQTGCAYSNKEALRSFDCSSARKWNRRWTWGRSPLQARSRVSVRPLSPFFALILAACANPNTPIAPLPPPEPIIQVREVRVPVPTPCLVMIPMEPGWSDTDAALHAATNVFEGVKLLLAGRLEARDFIHRLEALMQACVKP